MVADLQQFIVEMYTPGEIVDARKPFGGQTAPEALQAAMAWIADSATNFRVVDFDGTIIIDELVADLR